MNHEIDIESVAHGGEGVGRIDGRPCFVPYALPGERVRVEIGRQAKGVQWGAILEVLEPSSARSECECPVFGKCGGCSWLHYAYPEQAQSKQQIVRDCFQRIGKLEVEPDWIEDPSLRLGYRTRAQFQSYEGRWGFHEQRTHNVVEIESCPLCHPKLNEAFAKLRTLDVKGPVEITVNPEGEEVLVWTKRIDKSLRKTFEFVNSPKDTKRSAFTFDDVPIVNGAFSQSSLLLNRILRTHVHKQIADNARVLDLYCGSGNLSLTLGPQNFVFGLDQNRHAIKHARGPGVGKYRVGSEKEFSEAIPRFSPDCILLDPPRAGAKEMIPAIASSSAEAIVYVSCDPATLARDAAALVKEGWSVANLTVLDLYPNTPHVESVCVFRR